EGDPDEALRLIDRAAGPAQSRAAIAEPILWRRLLAPDSDPGGTAGLPEPHRLLLDGDWRGAARCWEALGAPYERALALLAGDAPAQREALAIFDSLGATAVAAHVRALLRRRGVSRIARGPRAATRANPAGLTPREMEVLAELGRGASNKRIAQALALSP